MAAEAPEGCEVIDWGPRPVTGAGLGLLHRLQEAPERRWTHQELVGDSREHARALRNLVLRGLTQRHTEPRVRRRASRWSYTLTEKGAQYPTYQRLQELTG